jgi:hypothetical protein
MSPSRRRTRGGYRPPRNRSEVITAVAAVVGVLAVTVVLIWFLRPSDSSPSQPNISTPVSVPEATLPADSTPATAPASSQP